MMNKFLDYTIYTRDTTVGHWRFNNNTNDLSSYNNNLVSNGELSFIPGVTENDITAIDINNPTSSICDIPAALATDFDMGTDSFTIEMWINPHKALTGDILVKHDDINSKGWGIYLVVGRMAITLDDGTVSIVGFTDINIFDDDDKWVYVVFVIDRISNKLRLYYNGIEDINSPYDISTLAGDISAPTIDLSVGKSYTGAIDEICISKEVISSLEISNKYGGHFEVHNTYNVDDIVKFIPQLQDNANLREFLIPFTSGYNKNIRNINELNNISIWDKCPSRYLDSLVSLFNFELIDSGVISEDNRRKFIQYIDWIYHRKGNIESIKKLLDLLGLTYNLEEINPAWVPFILNDSILWDTPLYTELTFNDNFSGNLSQWEKSGLLNSYWEIVNEKLRATANNTDDPLNTLLFSNTNDRYYLECDFEVISPTIAGTSLGFYLKFVDSNNWVRLIISTSILYDKDFIILDKSNNGVYDGGVLLEITDTIIHEIGIHKLWVYANHVGDNYTIGIDNTTLIANYHFVCNQIQSGKSGLYLNYGLQVDFDNVSLRKLNTDFVTRLIDDNPPKYTLAIEILNNPNNYESILRYISKVIPNYLPFYIYLGWIHKASSSASFNIGATTINYNTGYILSGNRGISFNIRTNNIEPVLGSLTATPDPISLIATSRFSKVEQSLGMRIVNVNTNGISSNRQAIPAEAYATAELIGPHVNLAAYPTTPYMIDGNIGTYSISHNSNIGVRFNNLQNIRKIKLYNYPSNVLPDGVGTPHSANYIEVWYSTNPDPNSSVPFVLWHSTNAVRNNHVVVITIDHPIITAYWVKLALYNGDGDPLKDPNGNQLYWSEIELYEF